VQDRVSKDDSGRLDSAGTLDFRGVVAPALVEALALARAGRWDLVEQLAHELGERRERREGGCRVERRPQTHAVSGEHYGRENVLTLYAAVEQGHASPLPAFVRDGRRTQRASSATLCGLAGASLAFEACGGAR
jgi:hypothetical protein